MSELVISRLGPDDRDRWAELFTGYLEFYETSLDAAAYERAWDGFAADETIHALGARLDGELVGIVQFLTHASTWAADVCYLQDLFTAPEARRHGVGRALIDAVVEWARARGCSRVYWSTQESNARARSLYDAVAEFRGFIRYEIPLSTAATGRSTS